MKAFTRVLFVVTVFLCVATLWPMAHSGPDGVDGTPPLSSSLERVDLIPQRTRVLGYNREWAFGGWATGVREEILEEHGAIRDPYTGATMDDIEIDHVIPLSAAWDLGAHSWTRDKRVRFANDPLNLIATSATENRAKSDQMPGAWMPPDRSSRCWYSRVIAHVAATYELALAADDVAVMKRQCLVREIRLLWIG